MLDALKLEIAKHGDQAAVVSLRRLEDIRQDLADLSAGVALNNFQKYILHNIYRLTAPETDFEARSIVLVASPGVSSVEIGLTINGRRFPQMIPASYTKKDRGPVRIGQYLNDFLQPRGFHVQYAPHLPYKRLAVRSGLARYGRNNICYVEGMGSFLNLSAYYTDIPCLEDTWQEVRQMDFCHTCRACLQACPTGAILPDRFLIDNERCLTYFNEAGGEWDFPAWIDPAAHHTLYGCMRCQAICPINKPYLDRRAEPVEFTEEETAFLMQGKVFDVFPEDLKQKVNELEMVEYLGVLPRNIRVLMRDTA